MEYEKIRIIRYESPIYYANAENFTYKIIKSSGINPNEFIQLINKEKEESKKQMKKIKSSMLKKAKKNLPDQDNTAETNISNIENGIINQTEADINKV